MSRLPFGAALTGVVVIGLGIGWWVGRPTPLPRLLHAHWTRVDPNAPSPPPTGPDQAPGWENRNVLRANLVAGLDKIEAAPCDIAARKAFFDAYAVQMNTQVEDGKNSRDENGPAFWRTDDDIAMSKRIYQLQQQNYVTINETLLASVSRLGPAATASLQYSSRGPVQPDKCGLAPTAGIGA
jgi:hypothetical protein